MDELRQAAVAVLLRAFEGKENILPHIVQAAVAVLQLVEN